MTDKKSDSRRIRVISETPRIVPIARGFFELQPGWQGRVKADVFEYATAKGWAVEVFSDGEPPAADTAPETLPGETVTFADFDEPPADPELDGPIEPPAFEGSE